MGSTVADTSSSLISTSTRVVRNASKSRPRLDNFMLCFGQIHAKRFLIFVMFYVLYVSVILLCSTSTKIFDPYSIPGFHETFVRGQFSKPKPNVEDFASNDMALKDGDDSVDVRNILNIWAYCGLASVFLAGLCLCLSEKTWRLRPCLKRLNPAFLQIPLLITILSLGFPIGLWSLGSYYDETKDCSAPESRCNTVHFWLNFTRYVALPVFLMWIFFLYTFFGCCLGFLYMWRRAQDDLKAREMAAASFRSFRNKDTLLRRPLPHTISGSRNKTDFTGCKSQSLRTSRKSGTGSRPTLSSIFKEVPAINSSVSAAGDYVTNDHIDLEAGKASKEIGSLRGRPLETVVEESESHGDSQGSLNNL